MNFTTSNLNLLFNSLSDSELKDLDKIVVSPFFNYREEEIQLFKYLLATKKKGHSPTGEDAFNNAFPNQPIDLAKLRHVMTYLTRIIHRYLAINEMEGNDTEKQLLLTRSLRRRNLTKLFLSQYNEAEHQLQNIAPIGLDTYYHQLQLHTEHYTYSITNRQSQTTGPQQLADDLDLFYIVQKLKHTCNILSYKNIFRYEEDVTLSAEALALIERKNMLDNVLVKLLYFNYQCLNEPANETHFAQLKETLLNHAERIDVIDLKDIYTLAINYCIKWANSGKRIYSQHLFDIYKSGLEKKVFEENGMLSPFTYKNIVAIAVGQSAYDWVNHFIEQYKEHLDKQIQQGFYAYCKGRYYFATAQYHKILDVLQEVDIKEQFTELDTRVLLIKTYFELDEQGLLDYGIDNLKQQLKRKNLQSYHAVRYKNFARMVSQLSHLRPYDKKGRSALKDKVQSTTSIAEKEWILSKIK